MAQRIAVLDDDQFLELMRVLLGIEGFEVDAFSDVFWAWLGLHRERSSGIILDIHRSHRQDGWIFLRRIKADPFLCAVPLVVCSADETWTVAHAAELAALGGYILLKPFDIATLRTVLRQATLLVDRQNSRTP